MTVSLRAATHRWCSAQTASPCVRRSPILCAPSVNPPPMSAPNKPTAPVVISEDTVPGIFASDGLPAPQNCSRIAPGSSLAPIGRAAGVEHRAISVRALHAPPVGHCRRNSRFVCRQEMALTKLLSNPVGPLKVLLEGPPRPPRRRSAQPSRAGRAIAARHPHPGRIVGAIVRVLADRQSMQAKEVHTAVEALLGEPVSWSSIKNALAANVCGPSPRFVRLGRGRYALS